jgi:dTDP-4-dehydrorhamnose 3,5-epimerase
LKFHPTALDGVVLVESEPIRDDRGYFVRTFCARELELQGIASRVAQSSLSFNAKRGTLRGLHFQSSPSMEDKLVSCTRGAIFDVLVDLRTGSPTFGRWVGFELSETDHLQLYAPKGVAHGFQTLTNEAAVAYQIAQFYEPERSAGVRFDDPAIGIEWPLAPSVVSKRDLGLPLLSELDRSLLMPFKPTTGL